MNVASFGTGIAELMGTVGGTWLQAVVWSLVTALTMPTSLRSHEIRRKVKRLAMTAPLIAIAVWLTVAAVAGGLNSYLGIDYELLRRLD